MSGRFQRKTGLLGWVLFVVSAVFFIVAGARSGDLTSLLGGVFFLAGCLVFMVPLLGRGPNRD